ncbi:LuxR C-terminal-related transcriptional regulator [Fulvivirga lutea]|uniref:Tetratricopeptide repeat protein n=1 Tax=Fulvivirga lutea TaxID=2810512 RepID=A0A974WJB6_9BACT|nr:LuxR C-terminal-related transcriptional regulator [Fulvivirga lutea]QSE99255.1 tetratricopeptide repeat protein [Fulvivirga lutea]
MWLNLHKISVFLLLFIVTQALNAQGIDEVEQLIKNSEYSEAIEQANHQLNNAKNLVDKARLIQLQADAYYYLNDIDKSLQYYQNAIDIHEQISPKSILRYLECVSHAGFCYRELGIYDKALLQYLIALKLAQNLGDSTEIAGQYANLGLIYGKLGDIDEATEYHMKAYNIDLALKDTAGIGFDLRNIADLKITLGDYAEAIEDIKESIELLELSSGNPNSLALRQGVLGKTYLAMNILDSANHYLNLSLTQHLDMNDSIHVALRRNDLSQYHLKTKEYERAITLASQARQYLLTKDETLHIAATNLTLIKAYLAQKNARMALQISRENIALCTNKQLLVELRDTYKLQSQAFKLSNQPYDALAALNSFQQLQDSIININNKKAVSLLEIKYEVYKKEQENELLALENIYNKEQLASQRTQYILTAVIFVIILISLIVIVWVIISRQKLKQKLLTAEINDLRNQIKVALEGDTSGLNIDKLNKELENPLTEREAEILNLALSDMSNSEIAEKTFVSVNTVKFHLKKIYDKIGVTSRKEALQFAIKSGR